MFKYINMDDENPIKHTVPGLVVNNNDPSGAQRLQVRISTLHQGIPDSQLPWARPMKEGSRASSGATTVGVPAEGSIVAVEYATGDDANLYWKGVYLLNGSVPGDFGSFPNCYGHVDENNNLFMVDTSAKTATITMQSGSSIQYSESGLNLIVNGNLNIKVTGNLAFSAEGVLEFKAASVSLNTTSTPADDLTSSARGEISLPSSAANQTNY